MGNTAGSRAGPIPYRSGITATDMLAAPSNPTLLDVGTGGSLAPNTAYNVALAVGNIYGNGPASGVVAVTTANDANNTHEIQVTIAQNVQNNGIAAYYDVMLSTDAAPKFVARITEAQRAAGGCRITAVGTVDNLGANSAGTVVVQVVGTGIQSSNGFYAAATCNGPIDPATLPSISMDGYSFLHIIAGITATDFRGGLPTGTYTFAIYVRNELTQTWFLAVTNTLTIGLSTNPLIADAVLSGLSAADLMGAKNVVVEVKGIEGNLGTNQALTVWIDRL
jgi:hypothetical protein